MADRKCRKGARVSPTSNLGQLGRFGRRRISDPQPAFRGAKARGLGDVRGGEYGRGPRPRSICSHPAPVISSDRGSYSGATEARVQLARLRLCGEPAGDGALVGHKRRMMSILRQEPRSSVVLADNLIVVGIRNLTADRHCALLQILVNIADTHAKPKSKRLASPLPSATADSSRDDEWVGW